MSEVESPAKKKVQNKNSKKKQNSKKNTPSSSGKQATTASKRGATNSRVGGLNNRAITQNRTMGSGGFPYRTMNTTTTNMVSGTLDSLSAPTVPLSGGTTSVYGYGGLPIAAPPNNSAGNYLSAQAHIPPAQRAGPYIPYFPHPKSS